MRVSPCLFFFQAEDGIRDSSVTGVQTCALPIWPSATTFRINKSRVPCRSRRYTVPEKSDLPQGTLDLLILKVVALGPVHGYAIAQRLEQVSRGVVQVPQGSLYPALHRLENRGLLAADWEETDSGREAKFYRLTRKGRTQLETEAASWQRLIEAVGLVLKLSEGGAE